MARLDPRCIAISVLAAALLFLPGVGFSLEDSEEKSAGEDESDTETELTADQREEAKSYFKAGSKSFEKGDYREAIDSFKKAYDIVHSPEILYNIGRCHEELDEKEDAVYHYEMYLRLYPTADDADNVRHRINILRDLEEKEVEDETAQGEPEEDEEDGDEWWRGIRLGVDLGGTWGLSGPTDAAAVPLEIFADYPMNDWLMIELALAYGRYVITSERRSISYLEPIHQVGLMGGARGLWAITDIFAFTARLGISIMWLKFDNDDALPWLAARGSAGTTFRVGESWSLFAAIVSAVGPVFGSGPENSNLEKPGVETEIGFHVGAEYVF